MEKKLITNIEPLLQDDYGGVNDCTLTSITTIMKMFYPSLEVNNIYAIVENIALKYFYNSEKGTNPLLINIICNKVLKYFKISKQSHSRIIKNIGFNFNFIKQQIDINNPIILNMYNDGNNKYINHSVIIIGYIYSNSQKDLLIYDNWEKNINVIDYNKLSIISSINYLK